MKAVPAQAAGQFFERPVAFALRHSFSSLWVHRLPQEQAPPIVIAPDGTIDLQWIDGAFRIAGPDREPQTEMLPAGTMVIGFRFHPAAAANWLGVPAWEIEGQRLMLDELWGAGAKRLAGDLIGRQGTASLADALEGLLARRDPPPVPTDHAMRRAFAIIDQGLPPGVPLVPFLGRALAMSERTLRRRFEENFGYGPKTLDRILRYQRFRRLAKAAGSGSTAMLAIEAGYADQAHLVRESRRLTGSTLSEIDRAMRCQAGPGS